MKLNTKPPEDLPGVRIYYNHIDVDYGGRKKSSPILIHRPFMPSEDPDSRSPSDFSVLFRALIPVLHDYGWFYDNETFSLCGSEPPRELHPYRRKFSIEKTWHLSYCDKPGFLEHWAFYVRDDWNWLWGSRKRDVDIPKMVESFLVDRQGFEAPFFDNIDIAFDNYDGVYWACYSRDASLLEPVTADWADADNVNVVQTTWYETIDMHEREAREWREKFKK